YILRCLFMPRTRGPGSGYERRVVKILESKGYYNIQRNIRKPYGELDIVAYKAGRKYLFEVKHTCFSC
ncbi:MAG: YraN family protein, partial [Desulfurococcales archaeon]|nr:YraN family protein [Desulfurococcales archaeon]